MTVGAGRALEAAAAAPARLLHALARRHQPSRTIEPLHATRLSPRLFCLQVRSLQVPGRRPPGRPRHGGGVSERGRRGEAWLGGAAWGLPSQPGSSDAGVTAPAAPGVGAPTQLHPRSPLCPTRHPPTPAPHPPPPLCPAAHPPTRSYGDIEAEERRALRIARAEDARCARAGGEPVGRGARGAPGAGRGSPAKGGPCWPRCALRGSAGGAAAATPLRLAAHAHARPPNPRRLPLQRGGGGGAAGGRQARAQGGQATAHRGCRLPGHGLSLEVCCGPWQACWSAALLGWTWTERFWGGLGTCRGPWQHAALAPASHPARTRAERWIPWQPLALAATVSLASCLFG